MQICSAVKRPDLLFPEYRTPVPAPFERLGAEPAEMFKAIAERDYLLHHPYQSFQPVIDFLTNAASDPDVVAIQQTVYRTGEDSELMRLLLSAARAGKEVTVVVELMARFDEQTNINWAGTARKSVPTLCMVWSATKPMPRWFWYCARRTDVFTAMRTWAPAITTPELRRSTPISVCSPRTLRSVKTWTKCFRNSPDLARVGS